MRRYSLAARIEASATKLATSQRERLSKHAPIENRLARRVVLAAEREQRPQRAIGGRPVAFASEHLAHAHEDVHWQRWAHERSPEAFETRTAHRARFARVGPSSSMGDGASERDGRVARVERTGARPRTAQSCFVALR